MPYCAEYCLDMPEDFPIEELTEFMAIARKILLQPESPHWTELAGASNLIGWRFRASFEDWQIYRNCLTKSIYPATHEEIFLRECALFGMFSAGVSVLESTAYAISALLSHDSILAFKFGSAEQRACSPRRLFVWLTPHPKAAGLSRAVEMILNSKEWSLWVGLRNRMTHRSSLPRIVHASIGAPLPVTKPIIFAETSSTPPIDADIADFDALHHWLAKSLKELLVETSSLVKTCRTD